MHATLAFDSNRVPVFQGSCGVVTHYLRKSLRTLGYKVEELYVPLSDKTSALELPVVPRPSPKDVRVLFEELFVRCDDTPEFRSTKNVSFFNLLATNRMERQSFSDLALMNSKFMVRAFATELAERNAPLPPRVGWAPLPLPLLDFPNGYPSPGGAIGRADFRALAREAHIGHAVRPFKMNCFATLSIMYHLNELARSNGTKPFLLVVSHADFQRCEQEIDALPIPRDVLDCLVPIAHVNNRSMIWIMKNSAFGLCYDDFVEPFGYYPVESVYLGCPIFTNGSGNLRHVLPKGHGVRVLETIAMHIGSEEQRRNAYVPVAKAIAASVERPEHPDCTRGAAFLAAHHRPEDLTVSLARHLRGLFARALPRAPKLRFRTSSYLRIADWEKGHFVTDHGTLEAEPRSKRWKELIKGVTNAKPGELDHRVIVHA